MTETILPSMVRRRRGVILNISSYAASFPTPLLSMYSASKIFVDYFSRSLQFEYSDKGITIQSVLPVFVTSKLSKINRPTMMVPTPDNYVRHQLRTVGIEARTYGYYAHKMQGFLMDSFIANIFGERINSLLAYASLMDVRRRYYRKNGIEKED